MRQRSAAPLTILVPTRDRPLFLLRLLRYYRTCGAPFPLWVLDSSRTLPERGLDEALREPPVVYRRYDPQRGPLSKLSEGLQDVDTPYAVVWADDDFLVPRTLAKAAEFLEAHQDFSVAHGRGGLFRLQRTAEHPVRMEVGPFVQRACTAASAAARLLDYVVSGCSIFYSVRRTAELRAHMAQCARQDFGYYWGELALACLAIIEGKVMRLDGLYILRQVHEAQAVGWLEGRPYDPFDWVTRADFPVRYAALRECLAESLARQDGVSLDQAREIVKRALWTYLTKVLSEKWRTRYGTPTRTWRARVRDLARCVPGLEPAWRGARRLRPVGRRLAGLPAWLRRSRSDEADVMPIYHAATNHP